VRLYSLQHDNNTHIGVQLQPKNGSGTVCFCIDCINSTAVDGWKKCTKVTAVATQYAASDD
jgi:hypothetical protein